MAGFGCPPRLTVAFSPHPMPGEEGRPCLRGANGEILIGYGELVTCSLKCRAPQMFTVSRTQPPERHCGIERSLSTWLGSCPEVRFEPSTGQESLG